jgi:hypothetical protein
MVRLSIVMLATVLAQSSVAQASSSQNGSDNCNPENACCVQSPFNPLLTVGSLLDTLAESHPDNASSAVPATVAGSPTQSAKKPQTQ